MIGKKVGREPLRIPMQWKQQDRAFVIQLERILDDVYKKIDSKADDSSYWGKVYPVGSIYMSANETSPEELFGGTWERLKDKFLLAGGDDYAPGDTGGAASQSYTPAGSNSGGSVGSHTLTTDEIPSHNHQWTGTSATCSSEDIKHQHTYTDYYATTTGNCAISVAQMPSHSHRPSTTSGAFVTSESGGAVASITVGGNGYSLRSTSTNAQGSTNNHNHSGANTSASRTANEGNKNHNHTVTATGSIGSKGGGGGHSHGFTDPTFTGTEATIDTMPPYLAVYMWKRTA